MRSRRGMVMASHPLATEAAASILTAGGSVADAAIAGAAKLCVVLPHKCSLGGDGFAVIHHAGTSVALNGSGRAPELATPDRFAAAIPERGGMASTVPAIVAGWARLHERFGRVPWKDLFAPAISLASEHRRTRQTSGPHAIAGTRARRRRIALFDGLTGRRRADGDAYPGRHLLPAMPRRCIFRSLVPTQTESRVRTRLVTTVPLSVHCFTSRHSAAQSSSRSALRA